MPKRNLKAHPIYDSIGTLVMAGLFGGLSVIAIGWSADREAARLEERRIIMAQQRHPELYAACKAWLKPLSICKELGFVLPKP